MSFYENKALLFARGIDTIGGVPRAFRMAAEAAGDVAIPFKKFVLKNGLTLIVHEDHKAPIVASTSGITSARRTSSRARPGSPTCSSI